VPRDFSSLHSVRNGSRVKQPSAQLVGCLLCGSAAAGVNLTTHFHLKPRLRISVLVTPLLHGVQSEKVNSLLIMNGILRIIRESSVNGLFRDVIHIIYHGVISKVP